MMLRAIVVAVALATAAASAGVAPARAAAGVITAGDRIVIGEATCSVAYVERRGADGRTYAITAGHCGQPGAEVIAPASGATGSIADAVVVTDGVHKGVDVGLVDFGTSVAAGTTVGAGRWPTDRIARRWPVVGDEVCRSGATTGTHCGVVVARHGMHQYLTSADMRRSAGGDSGGAVWLKPATPDRYPVIVGIWLGDFTSASGVVRGRFHGLWDAFSLLGVV
jgi:hypothetical protein